MNAHPVKVVKRSQNDDVTFERAIGLYAGEDITAKWWQVVLKTGSLRIERATL